MKRKVITILLLLIAPLLFFASIVFAQDKQQQNVTLPKNEIINKDYFATGDTVTISGTINGDAYIAAGNVIIEGTINGDLLVAGGNIDIRGRVAEDVMAVGGNITVSSSIGQNLRAAGGSITVTPGSQISQDVAAAGGSLNIAGPIGEDVNVAGGQITIGSSVGRNVSAAGNVTLTPNANISGDLTYWSATPAQIQPGAQVIGITIQNQPPKTAEAEPGKIFGVLGGVSLALSLIYLLSHLLVGLLIIKVSPYFANHVTEVINNRFWASLGVGLLILILVPIIILVLLITIIGFPIALILLAGLLILIFLTKIVVSVALGKKILSYLNPNTSPGWALLIGLIIYWLLTLIPFIGGLTTLLFTLLGLGAIFLERRNFLSQIRDKNLM